MAPVREELSPAEADQLRWAHEHLEHPSFAARLSSVIGVPIERTLKLLPQSWYRAIHVGAGRSIERAATLAIGTLGHSQTTWTQEHHHKAVAALAGAVGGFVGPVGLLVELPVMTVLMLRSIAAIALREGEDLRTMDARFACVEVFGLGARSRDDDGAETGYFGLRSTLAFHFGGALSYAAPRSLPGGMEFLRGIASRFGLVVSDDIAARLLPAVGAVSGALLNVVFMQHFQDVAKGHFMIRRLERKHGSDVIRLAYGEIARREQENTREYSPLEGW
jgi:hypothetical protein